ncbi:DUF2953 domain-containing protein [Pseudoflavonifractor sp. An85]|uniref:DUF2953 domain-containing protein n=1 Tax=Pseudoflavonifractor sp. An85 TaxID=1965661 RepID=UPI000B39078B|nr:DUF2953 domain-containing protein [Pseudoflavonifractor sp. An85]OUN25064.1 hypothetical protein B5G37_05245 [Pseudoflavonifractor sp. An85]
MNGWMVLGCVVLVLVLLTLIPLGARGQYGQEGFRLDLVVGPVTIGVYPKAKKKKKKSKARKEKKGEPQKKPVPPKSKLSLGSWHTFRRYLPLICEAAGELRRKMVVRKLNIHLVWADKDPASAAIGYGMINGVIGGLWNLIDHSFRVKDHKFVVDLDYEKKEPQVQLQAVLTLTVGQLISFGIRYGMKFIAMQREDRKKTENSKEVISHE